MDYVFALPSPKISSRQNCKAPQGVVFRADFGKDGRSCTGRTIRTYLAEDAEKVPLAAGLYYSRLLIYIALLLPDFSCNRQNLFRRLRSKQPFLERRRASRALHVERRHLAHKYDRESFVAYLLRPFELIFEHF